MAQKSNEKPSSGQGASKLGVGIAMATLPGLAAAVSWRSALLADAALPALKGVAPGISLQGAQDQEPGDVEVVEY